MTEREQRVAAAAAGAAEEADGSGRVTQVTLANGAVLRIKPVAPMVVGDAARRITRPEPPKWRNPDTDRDEVNRGDPEYLEALVRWEQDATWAGLSVALILGTEVDSLPEGFYACDDERWVSDLRDAFEAVGTEPPAFDATRPKARYLAYLRYYLIPSEEDITRLVQILTSGFAVTEAEVEAAVASFRRRARRLLTAGVSGEAGDQDGDHGAGTDPGDGA